MAEAKTKRRTAKTIRNLTNKMVHLRLQSVDAEKPYRVELQPRGRRGDTHTVPARLTDDGTFIRGAGRLFEIIPTSEADKIDYGPRQGTGVEPAVLVRHDENVIGRVPDWDGQGRTPPSRVGTPLADVPGSDTALHEALAEGNTALPAGSLGQPVTVERAQEGS
jgi:hypothetical protein